MATIIGAKVKQGKKQHLIEGKEYEVSEETAKILIENGQAKAKGTSTRSSKKEK